MTPKVSIIMPVYKAEKYLQSSTASVLNQKLSDLELILVDDGSPDQCSEMCDSIAQRDTRVRVIHQKNAGVSSARNAGLAAARGEYIGFVDSDDEISPDMYAVLYDLAEKHNCDLVCARYSAVSGEDWSVQTPDTVWIDCADRPVAEDEIKTAVLPCAYKGFDCAVWNKLFKKEIIRREGLYFRPELSIGEDYLFILNYMVHVKRYFYTTQILYDYYIRENSAIRTYRPGYMDNYYCLYKEKKHLISLRYGNDETLRYNNMLWYLMIGEDFLKDTVNAKKTHIKKMRRKVAAKIVLPYKIKRKFYKIRKNMKNIEFFS